MNLMKLANTEPKSNPSDDNYQLRDRAAHIIAERFALSRDHAREVARLAGIGSEAAR
jgi:hypothetical protein